MESYACHLEPNFSNIFACLIKWMTTKLFCCFCGQGEHSGGYFNHTGKAEGQWSVWMGHHRTIRRIGVWSTRNNCCRTSADQINSSDYVSHTCTFFGCLWFISSSPGLCWGAAKRTETCSVSVEIGVGSYRWWWRKYVLQLLCFFVDHR